MSPARFMTAKNGAQMSDKKRLFTQIHTHVNNFHIFDARSGVVLLVVTTYIPHTHIIGIYLTIYVCLDNVSTYAHIASHTWPVMFNK